MDRKKATVALLLVIGSAGLYFGFREPEDSSSKESGQAVSEPARSSASSDTAYAAPRSQARQPRLRPSPAVGASSGVPSAEARPTTRPQLLPGMDQAFEDWLWQFGYDLTSADVIMYLQSAEMPPERRARLLEFAMQELSEASTFFSSKEGREFLESLLADKSVNELLASRIGHTLRWLNRERSGDADDAFIQRFAQAKTDSEKVGLVSATTDAQFLRDVAFNHREASAVRAMAINNLLSVQKDDKTLKQLLDLTETQPELAKSVLNASASTASTLDEFMNVVEVLRKEGVATPENAKYLGETFAKGIHPNWLWAVDNPTDPFVKQMIQAYQSGSRVSTRDLTSGAP